VTVSTRVTASPSPLDDLVSFDMEIKEHMPRKFASRILLVNIEANNRITG
jgi:hypothetical protein